ncbi:MAG: LysR family transcriptional regulator [Accumulibacter sp.]|jgi:DNA-binding transcriptional LysR family regulator|uniref:LysR family transcriptional regulator n=1 Tax=Accumulibacter sp. TaxID=2053492 RepID=UPI002FC3B615
MIWLSSWASFVRIVETGSMAAAARRLDCTRAQISKQVGDLEKAFAVRLFERTTRKLRLTPAGEIFYQHALRALEVVDRADLAVRMGTEVPCGVIRISASLTFGRLYIAPLLPHLAERYPQLECELLLSDDLVDLIEDRIDLALRLTNTPPEDAVARPLAMVKRVICASPAYLDTYGRPAAPSELTGHQCFDYAHPSGKAVWRLLDRQGEEMAIPVNSRFRINNVDCVLEAVLAGRGMAVLPTYLCGSYLADGRLCAVLDEHEPLSSFGRHVYACYTPSRVRLAKVRVVLDELDTLFRPVPPWERAI